MKRVRGSKAQAGGRTPASRPPHVRATAILSVAAAVAITVWQALEAGSSPASSRSPQTPRTLGAGSEQQLIRLARTLNTAVYWKGPQAGSTYALTRTRQGWVYVSYLPPGASPPTDIHEYPSVVTYSLANAYAATLGVARRPGSVRISVPSGEVAFYYRSYPTSAYLAFKGTSHQIEVFDPSPERVRELVGSGQIRPIPLGHP